MSYWSSSVLRIKEFVFGLRWFLLCMIGCRIGWRAGVMKKKTKINKMIFFFSYTKIMAINKLRKLDIWTLMMGILGMLEFIFFYLGVSYGDKWSKKKFFFLRSQFVSYMCSINWAWGKLKTIACPRLWKEVRVTYEIRKILGNMVRLATEFTGNFLEFIIRLDGPTEFTTPKIKVYNMWHLGRTVII